MFVSAITRFFLPPPSSRLAAKQSTADPQNLEELQNLLSQNKTLKDWLPYRQTITACIEKHAEDPCQFDHFLSALICHAIEENTIETLTFLSSVIPFSKIDRTLKLCKEGYTGIEELAKEEVLFYPKIEEKKIHFPLYKEGRRLLLSFFSIMTRFIDSILEVLKLPNSSRFRNLFDRHQMWDLFFKFCAFIPYVLIPLLHPFVSDKVYLVAILLIAGIGILTICYKRWIKPLPTIIHGELLKEQIKKGKIQTVEERKGLQQLIQSLNIEPVLLVGKAGEGKTALVHHLEKWKNLKLSGVRLNCGAMIGDISFGHIEQMEELANQVDGLHKKVFLFFDEFYQVVANPNAFRMFKDRFLKGPIPVWFIVAVTDDEFKKLRTLDSDCSFLRCMNIVRVYGNSSDHLRLILRERRKQQPKHIRISDQAIEKVIEQSESEEYLKGAGRPAKAIRLFNKAVGICMAAYQGHYSSEIAEEIGALNGSYRVDADAYTYEGSSNAEQRKSLIALRKEVQRKQNQLLEQAKEIEKIKGLFDGRENLEKKYVELTHVLANSPSYQQVDRKTFYLLYHFYARKNLMTNIEEKMGKLKDIPLQVNEVVVQQAFEALKRGEEQAHA